MTFAAVVLWVKAFLASVPRSVYTHGLAFIVGVVLRGCLAVALVLLLVGQASAQPCPVNGSNCTCGCQQGGQCNCALTRVAPERLSRLAKSDDEPLDPAYIEAYQKFVNTKFPDGYPYYSALVVFVGTVKQDRQGYWSPLLVEVPKLRGFKAPCIVISVMHNGEPVQGRVHQGSAYDFDIYKAWLAIEYPRPLPHRPAIQYRQVFQPFGGNCPSGNCRSR